LDRKVDFSSVKTELKDQLMEIFELDFSD
jgi:hypothetical protein